MPIYTPGSTGIWICRSQCRLVIETWFRDVNGSRVIFKLRWWGVLNLLWSFPVIETRDRLGSSWFSISRDRLENTVSLGHIYSYPRSPLEIKLTKNQTGLKRFRPLCPAPALALELWTDWGVRGKWGKKLPMLGKGQFSSENHPIGLNNTFERKKIRQIDLWHQKAVFSACYLPKSLDYN